MAEVEEIAAFAHDLELSEDEEGLSYPPTASDGSDGDEPEEATEDESASDGAEGEGSAGGGGGEPGPAADAVPRALQRGLPMDSRLDALSDVGYWRELCPQLHISDVVFAQRAARSVFQFMEDPDTVDELRASMDRDGYMRLPPGEKLPWSADVAAVAEGVQQLVRAGWPPTFLVLYDEPCAHAAKALLPLPFPRNRLA